MTISHEESIAPILAARLERVALLFERALVSDLAPVAQLARHVEKYRGKMLRPSLVIISGMAARHGLEENPEIDENLDTLAAVVEMIHMATLVHDDVLDEAELRRGGATVNSLRGNETAVMLGDFLISSSFHLCSSVGSPWLNSALGETTTQLCSGEILQLSHRGDMQLDEATYFEIIRRKTGVLSGACCGLAARIAGAGEASCESLRLFGEELGMAFQIQDDVLDLVGDERVVGKTLGIDLRKGKLTLPIVIHLMQCTPQERAIAMEVIARGDHPELLKLVGTTGAVAKARQQAAAFVSRAKRRLDTLPSSVARTTLSMMADATIERAY